MPTHVDNLKCTVTGAPGTGTITVSTASSGARAFVAGDDGKTFDCRFTDGTAWETASGCLYTHAGTTLTRGTFQASSTGSAISLTSAATVEVSPIAVFGNKMENNALTSVAASPTTADVTGVIGTMHRLDISGLTAIRNVLLPVPTAIDQRIGVFISVTHATNALIIKGAATVTINGGVAATEWSRLFMANERVILRASSLTNWAVEIDGRILQAARMDAVSAQTGIAHATETTVTKGATGSWTITIDVGAITDAANHAIKVRRSAIYSFVGMCPMGALPDQTQVYIAVSINGAAAQRIARGSLSASGANVVALSGAIPLSLSAADSIVLRVLHTAGTSADTEWASGLSNSYLALVEKA